MYLNYSTIAFDSYDRAEAPELLLQTLGGKTIGILSNVFDLHLNVKFSEPSEMTFSIGAYSDGARTPYYDDISGFKVIYTKAYGVYLILEPEVVGDGKEEQKNITAYSLEKELEFKQFFLEEGTFNFWNPASPTNTVLGRILEIASGWHVGEVATSLIGRYRTFDDYNDYLLSFMYNTAPEKFRCIFVFDPYNKTINVYDADETLSPIPIYLDFDTIMQQLDVTELSNELVTAIQPYGADSLDIRAVNPIGTNWLYDLSWFISNGDIPTELATKWTAWQNEVQTNREYYRGLTSMRAAATARLLTEQAALADLEGELESINIQQNTATQQLAVEQTDAGREYQEGVLAQLKVAATAKKAEIAAKESLIEDIQEELDDETTGYNALINQIVSTLTLSNYFTEEELTILKRFFVEQTLEEETFVATDVDTTVSGTNSSYEDFQISITRSKIVKMDFGTDFARDIYTLTGGTFALAELHADTNDISADIIRGTLEAYENNTFLLSLYLGDTTVTNEVKPSGLVTVSGNYLTLTTDVAVVSDHEVETSEGTAVSFEGDEASVYLTTNISDYQKYSVSMELYDYAVGVLSDKATPTYEFDVDSANFIFAQELAPFRNELKLGRPIYLRLHNGEVITPVLIEFEVDFEDRSTIDLIFSNRFKRPDNVNTLKDMIETSYSSSHSFETSKYIYGKSAEQSSKVSEFMNGSLDAAVNTILAAQNQSVIMNGAGILVGGESNYQLRIVDQMIAMSDDGWQTAKLAIGHFYSDEIGDYFGVNADVIGGKLLVGNSVIIESDADGGVVKQFRFDSTGAWINNGTLVLQMDNGGKILIDPQYGIIAGTEDLYDTAGTTVTPGFIDENGDIEYDNDGFPEHANFFLDLTDGSAYFRGTINASDGEIGGWTIANDKLYGGSGSTYVALNSSGSNLESSYAIWAGATTAANAPFWVKRDGTVNMTSGTFSGRLNAATGTFAGDISAASGTFSGVVKASDYLDASGNSMMTNGQFDSEYLNLKGLNINNNFIIDENGNVTINAGTISWSAVTGTDALDNTISGLQSDVSAAQSTANSAQTTANTANSTANAANTTANTALDTAGDAMDAAEDAADDVYALAHGEYTKAGTTFISGQNIYSPNIYSNQFTVYPQTLSGSGSVNNGGFHLYGYYNSTLYHTLAIEYRDAGYPISSIYNPSGDIYFPSPIYFADTVDFTGATVTGLYLQFTS